MTDSLQQTAFPPPQVQPPVRPSWNPVEEARRNAELEAAAAAAAPQKRKSKGGRGAPVPPPVDLTATAQIRAIQAEMPTRHHKEAGAYRAVMIPRAITVTGFFLGFAFPALFLYLNRQGHAPLVNGVFEPDEYATRLSLVLLGGAALCMLVGWLWWGVAAALNAQHKARWSVSPMYVPLTYFGVAVAAVAAAVSERWLHEQVIYARAVALAFAVVMYFSTLSAYRRSAQSIGGETHYWTRLIVVPWMLAVVVGVVAWFWNYLPTQAVLGAYVGLELVAGLYGLWMYQAMAAFDRACAGTRQMRQDNQDFAKFFKPAQ